MVDYVAGLIASLRSDETLQALVEDRVYGLELDRQTAVTNDMPRMSLVVRVSGGPGFNSYAPLTTRRIDLWAYGPTPERALAVANAADVVMSAIKNTTSAGVKFDGALDESGPRNFREPETEWPVCVSSWLVQVRKVAA